MPNLAIKFYIKMRRKTFAKSKKAFLDGGSYTMCKWCYGLAKNGVAYVKWYDALHGWRCFANGVSYVRWYETLRGLRYFASGFVLCENAFPWEVAKRREGIEW